MVLPAMPPVRAHHFPRGCRPRLEKRRFGDIELEIASPALGEWEAAAHLLKERRQVVRRRKFEDDLSSLQQAFDLWHRPDSPERRAAEAFLPAVTGFSPEMIRHGVPLILAPLNRDSVESLYAAELRGDSRRTPIPAELIVHILSGNLPGLGAVAMHLSLAIGSAALLKTAAGDPLSAALWAQTIAQADPELGDCLAVTYWPGGSEVEAAIFNVADVVVASGSDAAIAAIATRVRGRFCGHGHRISFAVIGKECLDDAERANTVAAGLARDISLWDQQGCLSPQVCYIENGGAVGPLDFATMLAEMLQADAEKLPPGRLSLDEQADVIRFREEADWAADTTLFASSDSTAWSIAVENGLTFRPTCLNRCIRLIALSRVEEMAAPLAPCRSVLEAAGIAVGAARRKEIVPLLAALGVHRICGIGKMQEPPLSWCVGGRPRIGDWVEWMEDDARDV